MTYEAYEKIFRDTAFVRTGGSPEELKCARYLQKTLEDLGLHAELEAFPVDMSTMEEARLICDGREIPCTGYLCAGSGEVEAPLYYLTNNDPYALSQCRGKIVLSEKRMGYWQFQDLRKAGALGFLTYGGNIRYADHDLEPRELRSFVHEGHPLPGVHIRTEDAIDLVKNQVKTAKIVLKQHEYEGNSHNVILDLPGDIADTIVFSAHYDSVPLSVGAWDNMSGCVGLLAMAEYFSKNPHRASLRFVWCGCEERGLLGSKAYVKAHAAELGTHVLNINLDMIGSIMGPATCCVTAEDRLKGHLEYLACEMGRSIRVSQSVYPSDSTPFADKGVPAMTFATDAAGICATIHNRYDTMETLSMANMQRDIDFITAFAARMANAWACPVSREMPEKLRKKLDEYMNRQRPEG